VILIPSFRLGRGQNDRGHHMALYRKSKAEKETTAWALAAHARNKPALPCVVTLTRFSPSPKPLDDDNLEGSLKYVRDTVAKWLGVDDGDKARIRFEYAQQRAPWAVGIAFTEMKP
jgi:hypothetical protein